MELRKKKKIMKLKISVKRDVGFAKRELGKIARKKLNLPFKLFTL